MRVLALASGGKDSTMCMLECISAGHQIVALANLRPKERDVSELDSYMFQTVGHEALDLLSEATGLPLFRGDLAAGSSINQGETYEAANEDDEVEDLYRLVKRVKESVEFEAVCSGAIRSDYQRIRVENVCSRLGLVSLSYLWRRDQKDLLREMIDCGLKAVIIKVAALGLTQKHLGQTLQEMEPYLIELETKYGINVCGEGGEFETFTLDCPLFVKSMEIESSEVILHSDDAFAPVAYLKMNSVKLKEKKQQGEAGKLNVLKSPRSRVRDVLLARSSQREVLEDPPPVINAVEICDFGGGGRGRIVFAPASSQEREGGRWFSIVNLGSQTDSAAMSMKQTMQQLSEVLSEHGLTTSDLAFVSLLLSDLSDYAEANAEYVRIFGVNPPARACVQANITKGVSLSAVGFKSQKQEEPFVKEKFLRRAMHVQSISHWAPANIGPYSQAVKICSLIHVAGQIGLVPGSMRLPEIGGPEGEARLALQHIESILIAQGGKLRDVVQAACYINSPELFELAHTVWTHAGSKAPLIVVCVPRLPRTARVEWVVLGGGGVAESEEYQITLSSHADMKANVLVTENGQIVKEEREESDTKKTFFTAKLIAPEVTYDLLAEGLKALAAKVVAISGQDSLDFVTLTIYLAVGTCELCQQLDQAVSAAFGGFSSAAVVPVTAIDEDAVAAITGWSI